MTVRFGSSATVWKTMAMCLARICAQIGGAQTGEGPALDEDLAARRVDQPVEHADQSRLAAA